MESLCLEIPVIGTQTRGIRDLLEGDCGLIVKLADVEELAQAMARILDRPEEAKMMGKRGRERMKGYEVGQIIKLYDRLYATVLGEKNYALSQG